MHSEGSLLHVAVASSVKGKISKKSMAHVVVLPFFSLKFCGLPTTPQQTAIGVSRLLNEK